MMLMKHPALKMGVALQGVLWELKAHRLAGFVTAHATSEVSDASDRCNRSPPHTLGHEMTGQIVSLWSATVTVRSVPTCVPYRICRFCFVLIHAVCAAGQAVHVHYAAEPLYHK
jgi:hypothetical protein